MLDHPPYPPDVTTLRILAVIGTQTIDEGKHLQHDFYNPEGFDRSSQGNSGMF